MTILYVEDDPDDCDLFIEAINKVAESRNINCLLASDGEEALAKLIDFPQNPQIIFLDINMPRMDGKELVAEVKKREKLKNIPIVIYSTTVTTSDMQFFNRHGIFHFFNKPSDFDQLCDSLRYIFNLNLEKIVS
ncbi:response regulator [Chryseosolibacter indicus]|uniref:Response regulator n=1 Tax=Chryseosolibacter indicus TaxID=2782351 RepID=A0ABS5VR76_9BACT|nr:response regulator [Chryseosolibacter indicus]MBT1703325.1 response regulator [Chryseosolibacter indicus]